MLVNMTYLSLVFILITAGVYGQYNYGVVYSSSHICALKGSTVTISCTFTHSHGSVMKTFWTKSLQQQQNGEFTDLSVDPEYSQRLQYLGDKQQNCTVKLSHVTKKDERLYYFRFITDRPEGKWIGVPGVRLSVTDLQLESPERVKEGDSVRLTCKRSCELTDTPTFIWYRNSQTLTEGTIRNKLILKPVRREDAGRYRCAVDGHTLTSPEVYINVAYPPKSVSVSISGSAVIMEGDSVSLSCSSDSNPPAEINWYKGIQYIGSGRTFSISKISSDDRRKYKCRARNDYGEKYSDPVTINVMYPPRSVSVSINGPAVIMEGDSVTLSCSSDSNPPAEINWFKGKKLVKSKVIFSLSKISSDDSGEYKCKAKCAHGEKYSDPVTMNVQYPPRNVSVSVINSGQLRFDSVTLSCSSDSNPPALNFSWFKENQSSAVGSGQSFMAVQSGRFYCEAHNPHGAQRSDAVTVTVRRVWYVWLGITVALIGLLLITLIIVFIPWRKRKAPKAEDTNAKQDDLYSSITERGVPVSESADCADAMYASVSSSKTRRHENTEEIQYATVQIHKKKRKKEAEENECQYDHIRIHAVVRQSNVEEDSVIYSCVR